MTFEPEKLLQNIELRLGGRTALLAIGEGVLLAAFYLLMKGYSEHPAFSTVAGSLLLLAILGFIGLGLLGKSRPDETRERSLTHVSQVGVVIAHGLSSPRDMVQLMRALNGMSRLPLPSYTVQGSAAVEADRVPLTEEQSRKVIENIEQGIEKMLESAVSGAVGQESPEPAPQEVDRTTPVAGRKLIGE